MGLGQRVVQVSGFGKLVLRQPQIADANLLRQLRHGGAVAVVAEVNVHLAAVGIAHMLAAIGRLVQQGDLLVVGRDEHIHIRVQFGGNLRLFRHKHVVHVGIMQKSLEGRDALRRRQKNAAHEGQNSIFLNAGNGENPSPQDVNHHRDRSEPHQNPVRFLGELDVLYASAPLHAYASPSEKAVSTDLPIAARQHGADQKGKNQRISKNGSCV